MFQNLFMKVMMQGRFILADTTANTTAAANGSGAPDFSDAVKPIVDFINALKGPALTVVIALAAIYCIILGAKFAKAEEPQDREKAKAALKNGIIGFLLIFVLLILLGGVSSQLVNWVK
ncbi:MAG: pilin [Clostridiaceae bacterium]|nr:pilin [Clostridiaceae bacterium]